MFTLALSHRSSSAIPASGSVTSAIFMAARRVARWTKIRSGRRLLHAMDDNMLSDIGISRSEIDSATEYGRGYRLGPNYRL